MRIGGENMTREEWRRSVKAARALRGETLEDVAKAIYYSRAHLIKVLSGRVKSKRVEEAVSAYLGIDPPTSEYKPN